MVEKPIEAYAASENANRQKHEKAIQSVLRCYLDVSSHNQSAIPRWCRIAREQAGNHVLPWNELIKAMNGNERDISLLRQRCGDFDNFLTDIERGELQRLSSVEIGPGANDEAHDETDAAQQRTVSAISRVYTSTSSAKKKEGSAE